MGEILGAVLLASDHNYSNLRTNLQVKPIKVYAQGIESRDGQTWVDSKQGKPVRVLESVNPMAFYNALSKQLSDEKHSAVIASFGEQKKLWHKPPS